MPRRPKQNSKQQTPQTGKAALLRVIGGTLGGRKILYGGDSRTRPMKERVREAIFNLVGPGIRGNLAIDLFAGTGALAIEAISRGAQKAIAVERHFPTAANIRRNAQSLDIADRIETAAADAFGWLRRAELPPEPPWTVFCSPPYDFWIERADEMQTLVQSLLDRAPPQSTLIVEADTRFDPATLPQPKDWDVRAYPPSVVGVFRKA